ncbi:MAG TPA: ATP-binding protein [Sandaracinaceae bacterium LLY-WYZ-13_1]|nr:ATP-binding protein [Sandaracinaceae bacterium LLY-WYZ-13_1]
MRAAGEGALPETTDDERRVDEMRVAMLYQKAPIALATVVVNAALLAWLVDDAIPLTWRWGWYGGLVAVSALRAIDVWRHRVREGPGSPRRDETRFTAGALANGLGWGLGAAVFVTDDLPRAVLVAAVIGGMVAGASASTATSMRAYFAFALPAFVPVALRFLVAGSGVFFLTGVMLVVFGVAMSMIAHQGGGALVRSERLRLRNDALLEELARRSEDRSHRLRLLLDRAGVVLLVIDPRSFAILDASDAAAETLGTPPEALLGARFVDLPALRAFGDEDELSALIDAARGDGEQTAEAVWAREGAGAHLELSVSVRAVEGTEYGLLSLRDVSERRRLEAQLAQASLLASVGTLAAGVAHEVNNPLSYILGNLHHVRELLPDADASSLDEAVDEAIEGAERIRRIVEDLTLTTRSRSDDTRTANVEQVLESCLKVAENDLRHRARVERDFAPAGEVAADPLRLSQVLLNLLLNAAQAIEPGDAEQNRITLRTRREGNRVRVEVEDTGGGIPREVRDRIFEPFFTTKPPGEGTGLGLSVCHSLVTAAGGRISVASAPHAGTTFSVELPAAAAPARAPSARPPTPTAPGTRRRVLVIDDDEKGARAIARVLRAHDVRVVARATEALEHLERGERFDVILCDVMMPEMTGVEFFQAFRGRWPDRADRVVFLTGGAFTEEARAFLSSVDNACLTKPFDVEALRAEVDRRARLPDDAAPARAGA